jgi:hypothetical protein
VGKASCHNNNIAMLASVQRISPKWGWFFFWINQTKHMTQQFDNLDYNGFVRDYSHLQKGDIIIIPLKNTILRAALSGMWNREKEQMNIHASKIGCRIEEEKTKSEIKLKFV